MLSFLAVTAIFLCGISTGYVIKPTSLHTLGQANVGEYFWQPSSPITVQPGVVALRVSKSSEGCTSNCNAAALLFKEAGDSVILPYDNFCGSGGIVDQNAVTCFKDSPSQLHENQGIFAAKTVKYLLSEDTIIEAESSEALMNVGENNTVESLRMVNNVVFFPDKNTYGVSAEMTLQNGSVTHAFFRSHDGELWNFSSFVPFPIGQVTTSHRVGDTKVIVLSGSPGNFTSATSVFLGSRWEKVERALYAAPLSSWSSRFTSIYGGVKGRPGLGALAAGAKKGSEKPIDIVALHNRLVSRHPDLTVSNFSAGFQEASRFECLTPPFSSDPSDGCSSSSYVVVAPSDASQTNDNISSFYVFYDKLDNGFAPANAERGSTIHAIKLQLNETKEVAEHQAKVEEKQQEAEREKLREEARKKAQQEAEEHKRRLRREKIRKDKVRRAEFDEIDRLNFVTAFEQMNVDGEMIVVRDVDPDFTDIEKDTFFY